MNRTYTVTVGLRWKNKVSSDLDHQEFFTKDFDTDEQLCQAVASNLAEAIKNGRSYILSVIGDSDVQATV